MSDELFQIDLQTNKFHIPNFAFNQPLEIIYNNSFLTVMENQNIVYFTNKKVRSELQSWIIEKENDHFYIKIASNRPNFTQYLGSPNRDQSVFLYTSKNIFTQWKISKNRNNKKQKDRYNITYTGEKFDPEKVTLVIARYNEDIHWLIPYNDIAVIYNKGDPYPSVFDRLHTLSNIGREGHTYLYHITVNYDYLTERVIFLQGSPFEHNETVLFGIDNYYQNKDFQPYGLQYMKSRNIPPIELIHTFQKTTDYGLQYLVLTVDGNLKSSLFLDIGIENLNKYYYKKYEKTEYESMSLMNGYLQRSQFPMTKPVTTVSFSYAALFSVSKEIIQSYPRSVYTDLLSELLRDDDQGGANGYILERLWMSIFTGAL